MARSFGIGIEKPNIKSTHSPIKRNAQHKINKKTKARFSASYDIRLEIKRDYSGFGAS